VTLIGYHVAGVAGALITTLAMCGPTAVLAHFLGTTWDRFKDARWRITVQAGVVPISVGLVGVLGRDFFPKVDAGQIRLHFRARTGLRIEETARLADQVDAGEFFLQVNIAEQEVGQHFGHGRSRLGGGHGDTGTAGEVGLELPFDETGDNNFVFYDQNSYHGIRREW